MENLDLFKDFWKTYKKLISKSGLIIEISPEEIEEISFEISNKLVDSCQFLSKKEFTNIELAEVSKIITEFLKSKK
jgi:hypothetical protein